MFCIVMGRESGVPLCAARHWGGAVSWLIDNLGGSSAELRQCLDDGELHMIEVDGALPDDWESQWDLYDLLRIAETGAV